MPRAKSVDKHPQKQEIMAALIEGKPYRNITKQYGVSTAALSRYMREELARKVALAKQQENIVDGTYVAQTAGKAARSLRDMLEACNEYLRDPDDPEKFNVGPRAHEVEVVYTPVGPDGKPGPQERASLQELLDRVETGLNARVSEVRTKYADPRDLVIRTADSINKQLTILARIREQALNIAKDNEERRKIVHNAFWAEVRDLLADAFSECPKAKEKLERAFERIGELETTNQSG